MIRFERVTKRFGDLVAVDGVSFDVAPGEVVGLLGHNGAGKTTIIRMLAGLIDPDDGVIRVLGSDPGADGDVVRRRLGVLPSSPLVDLRLTAAENMRFGARLFGLDRVQAAAAAEELLSQLDLQDRTEDLVSTFSTGMKHRLSLARVLLPDPEVLLLDEPTSTMDPVGAREFRTMLAEQVAVRGRSVVLCTHDLSEAAQLCDQVLILAKGATLKQGSPSDLLVSLGVATTLTVAPTCSETSTALRIAREFDPFASEVRVGVVNLPHLEHACVPGLVREIVAAGVNVYGIERETASLEDLYLDLHVGSSVGA